MNIYLPGGSITFCDGIPMTTVATNSGVTFEEKSDAMILTIVYFLVSLSKSRKVKMTCLAVCYVSLRCQCSAQQQQKNMKHKYKLTVPLTFTTKLSPGIKS